MKKVEIHPEAVERVKKYTLTDTDLGFGKHVAPIMIQAVYDHGEWKHFELVPYGPIPMDPCAKVLHYAQEIFEGMKAFRQADDKVVMFRPELNARRFNFSARRMAMPEIPEEIFLNCCETITAYCRNLVPRRLGESLYLRPFMIATEVGLGVKPAKQYLFMVVASPSGNYFSSSSVKVYVERDEVRGAPGGVGAAKTGANYAASLRAYSKTLDSGCDQTMWLDAFEHKYVEEMSGMNFFALIDGKLVTPSLTDSILDGITRRSLIEIARTDKIEVVEKRVSIDELLQLTQDGRCTEAFVCGTAAVLVPVSQFTDKSGVVYSLRDSGGKISVQLREKLMGMQGGKIPAPEGWLYPIKEIKF
jgi:branched-chain amino acid aminotransferase